MLNAENEGGRKRLCVLGLGGGGFHWEAERLVGLLTGNLELVLVYAIASQTEANWDSSFPIDRAYVVRSPSMYKDSFWKQVSGMFLGTWRAFWILLASRPDAILAVGTAQAVPFGLAARLLRIPLIFVESVTRVQKSSWTGRLMSSLRLATKHYVQWESLAAQDRRTFFAGSLVQ
jgi:UDP-N-acetylglucosamine:LPS N-acetylglucosamine transferase